MAVSCKETNTTEARELSGRVEERAGELEGVEL